MATYTVAAGAVAKHDIQMVAGQVDTVTFTDNIAAVSILPDGTADVFYTLDGSTPAVNGASSLRIPAGAFVEDALLPEKRSGDQVKIVSAGTPKVSVQRGIARR